VNKSLTRRDFIKNTAVLSGMTVGACPPVAGAEATGRANRKRPNIIFLMSDQQRWDCIGKINPMVKTPALDRIADNGVLFDQAVEALKRDSSASPATALSAKKAPS